MVNQQTQQFMYRATILTVCCILGSAFLFMFTAAIRLGDGEAVRIIDAMQTPVLGAFASLIAFIWGHQASAAVIARAQSAAGAVPSSDPAPVMASSVSASADSTAAVTPSGV